jgi:diketogulonate reductase-like aldo/keto reductase
VTVETRPFGSAAVPVPVFGQGTWRMESDDAASCVRALRRGLDLGMTHVDTAELYGGGRVEETIVAPAIAGRRDEVFLVSKVMPQNATRAGTVRACEASLRRLRTDRLDCYLIHWPGHHPLSETIAGFEELVRTGKIRMWGVSNFDGPDVEEALAIAGPGRIACNQVLYHLEERAIEHALIPFCEKKGIGIVAYSPFGAGSFARPDTPGGRVLADVAAKHGATPRQVALRFLVRRPSVVTIPKAANVVHAEDNAAAFRLALDADDVARIDAAFPARRSRMLPTI